MCWSWTLIAKPVLGKNHQQMLNLGILMRHLVLKCLPLNCLLVAKREEKSTQTMEKLDTSTGMIQINITNEEQMGIRCIQRCYPEKGTSSVQYCGQERILASNHEETLAKPKVKNILFFFKKKRVGKLYFSKMSRKAVEMFSTKGDYRGRTTQCNVSLP